MRRKNSRSVVEILPIPDGKYLGNWLAFSVSVMFEGFEIRFNTLLSVGNQGFNADVEVIGGVAYVTARGV